jgi:protein-disulfide isomerase
MKSRHSKPPRPRQQNLLFGLLLLPALLAPRFAGAQSLDAVPDCKALTGPAQTQAQALFKVLHPYDGCDQTFSACLSQKPPHPIVLRLAADVCRKVRNGKTKEDIERSLARRAQSALPMGKPAQFALDEATALGPAGAPVTVVIYACARCPFCKHFVLGIQREVTQGALKDKVRLYFRPYPLKDHPGSVEGGLAMLSAAKLGSFWPFVTKVYENFDNFDSKRLPDWAAAVGMERAAFEGHYADQATRAALVASKQEGVRNKVTSTPTVYINGRKYVYELNVNAVVDVITEELERAASRGRK